MGEEIARKKRSRSGIIGYINRLIKTDINAIYDDYKDDKLFRLVTLKETIEEKLSNVMRLSEEIQMLIADDAEFNDDFQKYADIEVSVRSDLSILTNFIKEKQGSAQEKSTPKAEQSSKDYSRVKLPRFEIKKFQGDPTCWKSFIESFDAAVDDNENLSDIEKMNFLVNHIEGEAENVVKGLMLSNDNYVIAKKMLEDRFGDPQVLISSHMKKLLSLDDVTDIGDVKKLRQLYDEVEIQVRSLSSLGMDAKCYGAMLTPVLLNKIPYEFNLEISRKVGKAVWDIENILKLFNLELEAREKVAFENGPIWVTAIQFKRTKSVWKQEVREIGNQVHILWT